MYAIVEISGKQNIVQADEIIKVDKINAEPGKEIEIDKVLAIGNDGDVSLGEPYVEGSSVIFEVLENKKAKKVMVFKKKRRKRYEVKKGHRQHISVLKVKSIKN